MADLRHPLAGIKRGPKAAFLFALLLGVTGVGAGAVFADDTIGSITYLEGTVTMVRDGTEVDGVAIGQDLQGFDLIKTGDDSAAELSITAP